jgi:hypothetical protein
MQSSMATVKKERTVINKLIKNVLKHLQNSTALLLHTTRF